MRLLIVLIVLLVPTLDGLQRQTLKFSESRSLPSSKTNIPSEWKNRDWGKLERQLSKKISASTTESTLRSRDLSSCEYYTLHIIYLFDRGRKSNRTFEVVLHTQIKSELSQPQIHAWFFLDRAPLRVF